MNTKCRYRTISVQLENFRDLIFYNGFVQKAEFFIRKEHKLIGYENISIEETIIHDKAADVIILNKITGGKYLVKIEKELSPYLSKLTCDSINQYSK